MKNNKLTLCTHLIKKFCIYILGQLTRAIITELKLISLKKGLQYSKITHCYLNLSTANIQMYFLSATI